MNNDKIRSFKYPDAVIEAMVENYIRILKPIGSLHFANTKTK